MDELSSKAVRSLLTSLFPSAMIEDLAREREVVLRDRKIDVRMLVWTLVMGFAAGGEARSIAGYRRAYEAATNQTIAPSSFYDRFTEPLAGLLRDLLDHAVEEVPRPTRSHRASSRSERSLLSTRLSSGYTGFSRSSKQLTPVNQDSCSTSSTA